MYIGPMLIYTSLELTSKPHLLSLQLIVSGLLSSSLPLIFNFLKLVEHLLLFTPREACNNIDLVTGDIELLCKFIHRPFLGIFLSQSDDLLDDIRRQVIFFLVCVDERHVCDFGGSVCLVAVGQNSQAGVVSRDESARRILQARRRCWRVVYESLRRFRFNVKGGSDRVVQVGWPALIRQVFDGVTAHR